MRRWLEALPRPTGAGVFYILIAVLVIGQSTREPMASVQNLLVMVGAMVAGFVLAGVIVGFRQLYLLDATRVMPSVSEVGRPADIGVMISNRSRWLPCGMIEVIQPDTKDIGFKNNADLSVYCGPRSVERLSHVAVFLRRGEYELGPLTLGTSFPFGLVRYQRTIVVGGKVLVWPRRTRIPQWLMSRIAAESHGLQPASRHRGTDEILGLREYAPGDPVSRIHWSTSARTGTPMLLELEGHGGQRAMVILDLGDGGLPLGASEKHGAGDTPSAEASGARTSKSARSGAVGRGDDKQALIEAAKARAAAAAEAESLVSLSAGLFSSMIHASRPVGLILMEGDRATSIQPGYGQSTLAQGMSALATCRPATVPIEEWLPDAVLALPRETLCVLVTPRSAEELLEALPGAASHIVLVSMQDSMVRLAAEASRHPRRTTVHDHKDAPERVDDELDTDAEDSA